MSYRRKSVNVILIKGPARDYPEQLVDSIARQRLVRFLKGSYFRRIANAVSTLALAAAWITDPCG